MNANRFTTTKHYKCWLCAAEQNLTTPLVYTNTCIDRWNRKCIGRALKRIVTSICIGLQCLCVWSLFYDWLVDSLSSSSLALSSYTHSLCVLYASLCISHEIFSVRVRIRYTLYFFFSPSSFGFGCETSNAKLTKVHAILHDYW